MEIMMFNKKFEASKPANQASNKPQPQSSKEKSDKSCSTTKPESKQDKKHASGCS